jgi:hypothetical protein
MKGFHFLLHNKGEKEGGAIEAGKGVLYRPRVPDAECGKQAVNSKYGRLYGNDL